MNLFKQQAVFQLDQLPYSWHGLPHSSASVLGSQGPGRMSAASKHLDL